ncbi:unnamed protein product [Brassicogethes aeneus]|uniref:Uncharacterized protein n=1 Tax=Brassicogethes aeneus TaxID=1431903 RepID=A0A9P0AVK7_BRAAE|nr:unnamed protein product [Brassicogethes aeneus]
MYKSLYSYIVKSHGLSVVRKTSLLSDAVGGSANFSSAVLLDVKKVKSRRKCKKEHTFKNRDNLEHYLNSSRQCYHILNKNSHHKVLPEHVTNYDQVIRNIHRQPIKNKRFVLRSTKANPRPNKRCACLDDTDTRKKATYPTKNLRVAVPVMKYSQLSTKGSDDGTAVYKFRIPLKRKKLKIDDLFEKVKHLSGNDMLDQKSDSVAKSCDVLAKQLSEHEERELSDRSSSKLSVCPKPRQLIYRLDNYFIKDINSEVPTSYDLVYSHLNDILYSKYTPAPLEESKSGKPFFQKLIKKKEVKKMQKAEGNVLKQGSRENSILTSNQDLFDKLKRSTMRLTPESPKDYECSKSVRRVKSKRYELRNKLESTKEIRDRDERRSEVESVRRLELLMKQERKKKQKIDSLKQKLSMLNNEAQKKEMTGKRKFPKREEKSNVEDIKSAPKELKVFRVPNVKRHKRKNAVEITQDMLDGLEGNLNSKYYIVNRNKPFSYLEPDPNFELYSKKYRGARKELRKNSLDLISKEGLAPQEGFKYCDKESIESMNLAEDVAEVGPKSNHALQMEEKSISSSTRGKQDRLLASLKALNKSHHPQMSSSSNSKDVDLLGSKIAEGEPAKAASVTKIEIRLTRPHDAKDTEEFVCVARRKSEAVEAMPANQIPIIRDEGPKKRDEKDKKEKEKDKKVGKNDIRLPPATNSPALKLEGRKLTRCSDFNQVGRRQSPREAVTIMPNSQTTRAPALAPKKESHASACKSDMVAKENEDADLPQYVQQTRAERLEFEQEAEKMRLERSRVEHLKELWSERLGLSHNSRDGLQKGRNQNTTPMSLKEIEDRFRQYDAYVNDIVKENESAEETHSVFSDCEKADKRLSQSSQDNNTMNTIEESRENLSSNRKEVGGLCQFHAAEEQKSVFATPVAETFLCPYHKAETTQSQNQDYAKKHVYCLFHQENMSEHGGLCEFHVRELENSAKEQSKENLEHKDLQLTTTAPKVLNEEQILQECAKSVKEIDEVQRVKENLTEEVSFAEAEARTKDVEETTDKLKGILGGIQPKNQNREPNFIPEASLPQKKTSLSAFNVVLESKDLNKKLEVPLVRVNVYDKEAEAYLNNILKIEANVDFKDADHLDNVLTVFENNEITVHPTLKSGKNDLLRRRLSMPDMQIKIYQDVDTAVANTGSNTTIEFKKAHKTDSLMELQIVDESLQKYVNNVKLVQARILLKDVKKSGCTPMTSDTILSGFDFSINKGKKFSTSAKSLTLIKKKFFIADRKKFCTKSGDSQNPDSKSTTSKNNKDNEEAKEAASESPMTLKQVIKRIEENLSCAAKEVIHEKFQKINSNSMKKVLHDPLMKISPPVVKAGHSVNHMIEEKDCKNIRNKDMEMVDKIVKETKEYMQNHLKQKSSKGNKKNLIDNLEIYVKTKDADLEESFDVKRPNSGVDVSANKNQVVIMTVPINLPPSPPLQNSENEFTEIASASEVLCDKVNQDEYKPHKDLKLSNTEESKTLNFDEVDAEILSEEVQQHDKDSLKIENHVKCQENATSEQNAILNESNKDIVENEVNSAKSFDMLHFEQLNKNSEKETKTMPETSDIPEETKKPSKIPIPIKVYRKSAASTNEYAKYNYNQDDFTEILRLNQKEEEEALKLSKRYTRKYLTEKKEHLKNTQDRLQKVMKEMSEREAIKVQGIEEKIDILENPTYSDDISTLEAQACQECGKITENASIGSVSLFIDPKDHLHIDKVNLLKKVEVKRFLY